MRVILLAAGLFFLWHVSGVLLLVFTAALLAVAIHALARMLMRILPFSYRIAMLTVVLLVLAAIPTGFALLGVQAQGDFAYLANQLPKTFNDTLANMGVDLESLDIADQILGENGWTGLLGGLANYTTVALSIVTSATLVVIGGVFLAAQPSIYRRTIVRLFPKSWSDTTVSVMDNLGEALKGWMLGQSILMLGVGVVTTIGLHVIGVPSALGLGILAGILEIVPVAGPIIAAVPAILIALSAGYDTALWTFLLYLGVQQLESNLVVPIVQRHTVSLAPALGLLAILVFGILFGPLGVMLSAPLAVTVQVLVTQLYSRDMLGWEMEIPGTRAARSEPDAQ